MQWSPGHSSSSNHVLQGEIPPNDPCRELSHSRVRIPEMVRKRKTWLSNTISSLRGMGHMRVGGARDGNSGSKLGIREGRKDTN